MLPRAAHLRALTQLSSEFPVIAILGPRQVGKTTLARAFYEGTSGPRHWFDLEIDRDVARLADPLGALGPLQGLVVIDEVQLRPDLFRSLRVLADRPTPARFVVLGSASPTLLQQGAETLAGRIAFHEVSGFSLREVGPSALRSLWLRGGFPRSFSAASDAASSRWRRQFLRTFLERDLPQLGVSTAAERMRRFWLMLAHVHGQVLNWSELGRSLGVSDRTVRTYLDTLEATFMVRQLKPWAENISKRQVKSPKVFLTDPGLLHALLDIETTEQLEGHPKAGASWEGFAMGQVIDALGARPDQCYFWATQAGAELDLLVVGPHRRVGFEFKKTTAPATTRSVHTVIEDLKLDQLNIVSLAEETYPLTDRVRALSINDVLGMGKL